MREWADERPYPGSPENTGFEPKKCTQLSRNTRILFNDQLTDWRGDLSVSEVHIVVLAAGQGTRMKSSLPKVLHFLGGRPLIGHVLRTAAAVNPATVTVIVGYGADTVRKRLS